MEGDADVLRRISKRLMCDQTSVIMTGSSRTLHWPDAETLSCHTPKHTHTHTQTHTHPNTRTRTHTHGPCCVLRFVWRALLISLLFCVYVCVSAQVRSVPHLMLLSSPVLSCPVLSCPVLSSPLLSSPPFPLFSFLFPAVYIHDNPHYSRLIPADDSFGFFLTLLLCDQCCELNFHY